MITPELLIQARDTIEKLLEITHEQHSNMIFDAGMQYMEHTYGGYGELYEKHAYSAVTWDWYTYQWHRANLEILLQLGFDPVGDKIKNNSEFQALKDAFSEAHYARRIIYPAKIMSYAKP